MKKLHFTSLSILKTIFVLSGLSLFLCSIAHAQTLRTWATYYGYTGSDRAQTVTTDADGNVYMAGSTTSTFGIASGGFQNTSGGSLEAFLVKFDSAGNRLWATYYGNTGSDQAFKVVSDSLGNVYMCGRTTSVSGIASGGFQTTYGGGTYNAFLVKFDSTGNRLWATYYGGSVYADGTGLAVDAGGNIYMSGLTSDLTEIASNGFQNTYGGGAHDAYLVKFDASGNRIWATYYGGSGSESGGDITLDPFGNVYLSGYTPSTSAIAFAGFQMTNSGGANDAFLVKFDSSGSRQWATYYGGSDDENVHSIETDDSGNIYMSGVTASASSIAYSSSQNTLNGSFDAFLVKFDMGGALLWGTYYGGPGDEAAKAITTDIFGNVYIGGQTNSTSGIAVGGFQNTFGGGTLDAFVAKYNASGIPQQTTYYGGAGDDNIFGLKVDVNGSLYAAGITSSNANISFGGFQNAYVGSNEAMLVKFETCTIPPTQPLAVSGSATLCANAAATTYSVAPVDETISYTWSFPANWNGVSTTNSIEATPGTSGNISVTANNACGASVAQTLSVTVNALPSIIINAMPSFSVCAGSSISLTGGGNAISYSWSDGITNNSSFIPSANHSYTVTATGANGCQDTASRVVTVNPLPTVSYSQLLATICINDAPVILNDGSPLGGTYIGTGVNGNAFDPSIAGAGNYTIVYTYTDGNSCTNTDSSVITVNACVGIENNTSENEIKIYPNPTSSFIHLSGIKINSTIEVYNLLAEKIILMQNADTKAIIDLSKYPNGIYFIKAGSTIKKIIKE